MAHMKDAEWNRVFGQRLRFLREKAGLTQVELALALGYTEKGAKGVLSAVERGDRNMDKAKIRTASKILNIPMEVLTDKEQVPEEVLDIISDFVRLSKQKDRTTNWPAIVSLIKSSLQQ